VEGQKNGGGDGIVGDVATCVEKILNPLFGNHDGLVSLNFQNSLEEWIVLDSIYSFYLFPIRKGGIFSSGKEIEGLRGGVHRYAAQARPKIDTARAKKNPYRTETKYAAGVR
jgi:hypothetical protein